MNPWRRLSFTVPWVGLGLALLPGSGLSAPEEAPALSEENVDLSYEDVLFVEHFEIWSPRSSWLRRHLADARARSSRPIAPRREPLRASQRPVDRFPLGFPAPGSTAPAFSVCQEIEKVGARRLPHPWSSAEPAEVSVGTEPGECYPHALTPIEPPGVCIPAGVGVRAYVDVDLWLEPEDESDDGDRGWSAGLAIEF